MADLLSILSSGASSLSAAQAAAATASHNLENASTDGYARQRVTLTATIPAERVGGAYIGRGVTVGAVTQARDRFLEAQIPGTFGEAARSAAGADALESVHALDAEATGGLSDALSGFYDALRALSQDASDPSLRQEAVAAAGTLARSFNATRQGLEDARTGLDAKITGAVSDVNDLARTVAGLNQQIRAARAGGGEPNDLLDARQKALDQLAQVVGGVPVATAEGDVSVALPGGAMLVNGTRAATLSTYADTGNAGHLALRLTSPGGTRTDLRSVGGEIGGELEARDGALATAVGQVDALAYDLAQGVNAVHRTGYGADGSTGLDLFVVGTSASGAAGQLAVEASIAADPDRLATAGSATAGAGDATGVNALVDTESNPLSGGLDPAATLAQVTTAFGSATKSLRARADYDSGLSDQLVAMRESSSGVSVDEELIEMQKAQRAYQAIAQVIQASSDMFDTLLSLK